jgi:hypothetical protein
LKPPRKKYRLNSAVPETSDPPRRRIDFHLLIDAPRDLTFAEAREMLVRLAIELTSSRLDDHAHDIVMDIWRKSKTPAKTEPPPRLRLVKMKQAREKTE